MSLTDHPTGNYRFLPGIAPYSCGVVSSPAFEIVQVTFQGSSGNLVAPPVLPGGERVLWRHESTPRTLPVVVGPGHELDGRQCRVVPVRQAGGDPPGVYGFGDALSRLWGDLQTARFGAGTDLATPGHDAVRDDLESPDSPRELCKVRRQDISGSLGGEVISLHLDV